MPGFFTQGFPVPAPIPPTAIIPADVPGIGGSPPQQIGISILALGLGLGPYVALTDAALIVTDLSLGSNFSVTLGGNRTLSNPIGTAYVGATYRWRITQDGTGSRTLAYGTQFKFPGGAPTLTTTAGATDVITAVWNGTTYDASIAKAFA